MTIKKTNIDRSSDHPILFIDGLNMFIRHYSVNPSMSIIGHHVGAIVGFLNNIDSLLKTVMPSKVVIVWDSGGSSRRRSIYPDYKKKKKSMRLNRFYDDKEIPNTLENFDYQLLNLIKTMNSMPIKQMFVDNTEADDVIAYLCKNALSGNKKVIASSDKDYYQLLDKKTVIWSFGKKQFINYLTVKSEFNISPINFCTAKAICGDSSDNIPGVTGAGFKVLAKRFELLNSDEYVSIHEIFNICEERAKDSKIKLYKNILSNKDIILRNWKLMYLNTSNLSYEHIKSIDAQWNAEMPKLHKMNIFRKLLDCGVQTVNVDELFITLKHKIII